METVLTLTLCDLSGFLVNICFYVLYDFVLECSDVFIKRSGEKNALQNLQISNSKSKRQFSEIPKCQIPTSCIAKPPHTEFLQLHISISKIQAPKFKICKFNTSLNPNSKIPSSPNPKSQIPFCKSPEFKSQIPKPIPIALRK